VVPPEQGEPGQQPSGFVGSESATVGLSKDLIGVHALLGGGHLADRVGRDRSFVLCELQYAEHD
jgi:hypothetical protein